MRRATVAIGVLLALVLAGSTVASSGPGDRRAKNITYVYKGHVVGDRLARSSSTSDTTRTGPGATPATAAFIPSSTSTPATSTSAAPTASSTGVRHSGAWVRQGSPFSATGSGPPMPRRSGPARWSSSATRSAARLRGPSGSKAAPGRAGSVLQTAGLARGSTDGCRTGRLEWRAELRDQRPPSR
jgi:hypothetical protein